MTMPRREFVRKLGAGAISPVLRTRNTYDVAVIGAGVFGAWTAYELQKSGQRVVLLDCYGPANSRASSGGESRVIRCAYGDAEIYSRWAMRSLAAWEEFFTRAGQPLLHRTGVLWLAQARDPLSLKSLETLKRLGVVHERLERAELEKRFPQMSFGSLRWGIFEPQSGVLMARRAVQLVVAETVKNGAHYINAFVNAPKGKDKLDSLLTSSGEKVLAGNYVFACGPWLAKMFPSVVGARIHPTRQDVFFFGTPPGDKRFAPPQMPVWADFGSEIYGVPDLENRGFKIGLDRHGPSFDPDTAERLAARSNLNEVRKYLGKRFPALKNAPLIESRVCQYENTSNGDFLIDRHPDFSNVWLVGGGSGHGFKHGPAVGEYVRKRVSGESADVEARFSLASKKRVQRRTVF